MKYFYISFFALSLLFVQTVSAQYGGSASTIGQSLSFGFEGNSAFAKQFNGTAQYAPYQLGLGFVTRLELPLSSSDNNINFTATTGITAFFSDLTVRSFFKKTDSFTEPVYYFIPVKAGLKYYFGETFYAEGEAGGIVNASNNFKITLSYAPGIGVAIPFRDIRSLDLGVRYETYNQTDVYGETFLKSFVSVRLVYKFGIGVGQ
jgi:hypothetical protein